MTGIREECALHASHRPEPLTLVTHHIIPKGMGGGDDPGNQVRVCDTGHRNVHLILAAIVFGTSRPGGTHTEIALAQRGHLGWIAAGRPGNPHAAYALHSPEAHHE